MRFGTRRVRIPGDRRRALNAAIIGAIVLLVLTLAAFTEPADETPQIRLSSGSAWLVSPTVAAVTLVDGASESIVAARRLDAAPDDDVSVTQSGNDAFVVNDSAGTVARVDGATLQVKPARQFADSAGSLELVAGPSALYVLDANRGQAFRVDPRSLDTQVEVSLAARPGPSQSVVDTDGRLWVVDADRGSLIWIDGTERSAADEPPGPGSRLILVRDRPVLTDPASGHLRAIDADGDIGEPTCLDIQDGADPQLLGSRTDDVVYAAVSQTGTLLTAATDTDDCAAAPLTISDRGDVLGAPVSSDRFLFVPNLTTGSTIIVDTAGRTVLPPLELVEQGHDFELIAKDGLVFYNDLDGSRAGVLTYDGTDWQVGPTLNKYDPGTGEITALNDEIIDAPVADAPAPTDSPAGAEPSTADQPDSGTSTFGSPTENAVPNPTTTRTLPTSTPPIPTRPALPGPVPAPADPNRPDPNNPAPNNPAPNNPPSTLRLTLSVSGDGTVTGPNGLSCPSSCSVTLTAGTEVSLTATFPARSIATWSGPCAGRTTDCRFTPTGDTLISLTVAPPPADPVLTVTLDGRGRVTGSVDCPDVTCTATIPAGQEVTLTASPDARFAGWSEPCAARTTPTCTFRITGDVTVEASFTANAVLGDMEATDADPGIDQRVSFSVPIAQAGNAGVWTWTASGPTSQGPTEGLAEAPFETSFTAAGDYTVHLDVAYPDGTSDEADRVVTVADQCAIAPSFTDRIDFRDLPSSTAESIDVEMSGCFSAAAATPTVTSAAWLTLTTQSVFWTDDNTGSTTGRFTFRASSPPRDGMNQDAISLTLPNGQSLKIDVLENLPPVALDSYNCAIQDGNARIVFKAADADIASNSAVVTIGPKTWDMQPFEHGGSSTDNESFFEAVIPPADLPATRPSVWTATLTDPFGASANFAGTMSDC